MNDNAHAEPSDSSSPSIRSVLAWGIVAVLLGSILSMWFGPDQPEAGDGDGEDGTSSAAAMPASAPSDGDTPPTASVTAAESSSAADSSDTLSADPVAADSAMAVATAAIGADGAAPSGAVTSPERDALSVAVLLGDRPAIIAVRPDPFVVTAAGQRFEPGDELPQGVTLHAIEAEALHFSQDGEPFTRAAFARVAVPVVD